MGRTALLDAFLQSDLDANGFVINNLGSSAGGNVTSVGLTMPASFAVSGSPITGSGTLGVSWGTTGLPSNLGALPPGGGAGQWLAKGSGSDYDTQWVGAGAIDTSGLQPTKEIYLTSSGTYTPPPNVTALFVECYGAGGGSGGALGGALAASVGGAGAGGGYACVYITTPAASYPFVVGAGGLAGAGAPTPGAGGSGGTTSFGSPVVASASGGAGGLVGPAADVTLFNQNGVTSGTGTVGDLKLAGNRGLQPIRYSGTSVMRGRGGYAPFLGAGGPGPAFISADEAGQAGVNYGEGAGGGTSFDSTAEGGAAGAGGLVHIKEYYGGLGSVPGSVTWLTAGNNFTVPTGARAIFVECWGGGGGGWNTYATSTGMCSPSGGGGGGAYSSIYLTGPLKASYSYVIGAGGPGNTNGGATSFDSPPVCSAAGGAHGTVASVNGNDYAQSGLAAGGAANSGIGSVRLSGSYGGSGVRWPIPSGAGVVGYGGAGGHAPFSAGGGPIQSGANPGLNATSFGGGGGGAFSWNGTGMLSGGAGFQGAIKLTLFF